ncbi:ATP-binding cassette domain-containing protein [Collinsella sp. AGMB00827]|uniref:ATP-binding cassette domain-containing protein n=1 Tax=Collinsella ureilytica TaxID=2869515 RepID=A0ABS7MIT8_9ACTN|nr:ATP-binding cassette domain-containing protein [Collinsella urealyticum]MBY4797292.1 ATP-binding cassette domain-containing protein [Collinsella urealyticum]
MDIVEVRDLSFGYTSTPVLRHVDFTLAEGESCCISGENGSGKSTLLRLLLGELSGYTGTINLFGQAISHTGSFSEVGYVPQANVLSRVAFPVTCQEMVAMGLAGEFGFVKIPRKAHLDRATAALERMGLAAYAATPFNELSGGLQQRVMIARALANTPRLLVLDEPTAGVDHESKVSFLKTLEEVSSSGEIALILVTHETELVVSHVSFDRELRMVEGSLLDA